MNAAEADTLARRVAEHLLAHEGTGAAWGIRIDEVRVGYARLRMTVQAAMLNGHRTIHGGMVFALADTAFAYACNSRNEATVAAGASIIFLAPAQLGETLTAEAVENARTGRSGAYTVTVSAADGRVIGMFSGQSRTVGGAVLPPPATGD